MTSIQTAKKLTTSYAYPWVLVFHNGHVEGQRPRTILGFVHEAVAEDGKIVAFRVTKFPGDNPTKRQSRIEPETVAHEFRVRRFERPDRDSIENARALVAKRWKQRERALQHA